MPVREQLKCLAALETRYVVALNGSLRIFAETFFKVSIFAELLHFLQCLKHPTQTLRKIFSRETGVAGPCSNDFGSHFHSGLRRHPGVS